MTQHLHICKCCVTIHAGQHVIYHMLACVLLFVMLTCLLCSFVYVVFRRSVTIDRPPVGHWTPSAGIRGGWWGGGCYLYCRMW